MMKQNYNNKTKLRSAWFALVLLMITALPITAQNVRDRFQVGQLWYEVVDATAKTVKVTYGNENLDTEAAKKQNLKADWADISNNDMKAYKGELNGKITIPEKVSYNSANWTVVAIGTCAFINERGNYKKGDIELEIVLPETIEHIEEAAFYQCIVWNINFPQNLKTIGRQAFYKGNLCYAYNYRNPQARRGRGGRGKSARKGITIPGKTAIGPQAFEECSVNTGKRSILLCPNITYVGYQAFKGSGIQIEVPKSANLGVKPTDKEITDMYKKLPGVDQRSGVEAFTETVSNSVTLQKGITTIPTGMFDKAFSTKEDKDKIKMFEIPLSVTTIEERAFANAGILSFSELSVVRKIGAKAFENGALTGDFVILDNVEEIGDGAFKGNTQLSGFTLIGSPNCTVGAGILEGCPIEYLDLRNVNSTYVKSHLTNLSREANSGTGATKTIVAGLPVNVIIYLPDEPNISFAEGQDVNFVKSNGECTKLLLEDGVEYEFPYEIKASVVVYDRDFSAFASGKNCFTIFLPYAVKLPTGIRAYNLDLLTKRNTGKKNKYNDEYIMEEIYVFKSIPDGSTLEANRPYLLRITDGNPHSFQEFKAIGNPVVIAKSNTEKYDYGKIKPNVFTSGTNNQSYVFTGSTEKIRRGDGQDQPVNNPYTLGRDKTTGEDLWKRAPGKRGGDKFIPPFRGIIMPKPNTSPAKQFVLLTEDNQTTGINDVANDADAQQGAQRIYTMDGRYVGTDFDSLPSGMYIMKGKKTLKTK